MMHHSTPQLVGHAGAMTRLAHLLSVDRVRTVRLLPTAVVLLTVAVVTAGSHVQAQGNTELRRLAEFTFTSRGWATFGLALPQGAARSSVRVGTLATQTDVKTTWADGSIRFAIVTAKIDTAGSYAIAPLPDTIGMFTPTWPRASVSFAIGSQTYVAALPAFTGADDWLSSGALVRESRVVVTPIAGTIRHPVLQVIYDVRSYAGGGHRVDVTVQTTQDVPAGDEVRYDVAIAIDSATVFSKAGVTQPYLTRWRKTFTAGGLTEAAVKFDFEPFYTSRALPRYVDTVIDLRPAATGAAFDILQFGTMLKDMASPGGRPEIAPYPDWVARYLIHQRPEQRAFMLAHADLSGSWSGHITEADGQTLVTLDRYPWYWIDGRAPTRPNGPAAGRFVVNGSDRIKGTASTLETAHLPSLTFVPYLITGDRFYIDQAKLWANFALLATWPGDPRREVGKGILAPNQVRGIAWALRSIADTAAYMPDVDPARPYLLSRLQNNLDYLDTYARTVDGGPFGIVMWGWASDTQTHVSTWQNAYLAWASERAAQHGFRPTTAIIERIAKFQARMFISEPDYPQRYASPYYPIIGTRNGTTPIFFTSMKQIFDASYGRPPADPQPWEGYYGPETRILMMLGKPRRIPGAQEGLDYIASRTGVLGDMNKRSGWALAYDPLPASVLPVGISAAAGQAKQTIRTSGSPSSASTRE